MQNYAPTLVTSDNMGMFGLAESVQAQYINQYVLYDDGLTSEFEETFLHRGFVLSFPTLTVAQAFLANEPDLVSA